ncbi:unnamed protein product [Ambrosiozyma monospora]|uniref:Unnamed protein product n=1 Tax=Ambrosiozyma monospora TaxID=43982 RepID=A0ACB5SXN8_AMBMO|nr:unnamed protein product [Ambrosiozyma monospora]
MDLHRPCQNTVNLHNLLLSAPNAPNDDIQEQQQLPPLRSSHSSSTSSPSSSMVHMQEPSNTIFKESSPGPTDLELELELGSTNNYSSHSHSHSHSYSHSHSHSHSYSRSQKQQAVVSDFLNSHIVTDENSKQPSSHHHQHQHQHLSTSPITINRNSLGAATSTAITGSSTVSTEHKYCYRHNPNIRCNRTADERKMTEIQKQLEKMPRRDQEAITHVWSIFSAAPNQHRSLILQGLLTQCCFPQLSMISQEVSQLIKIDFIETLPNELALKVLCYLDCQSLCNAAQVSTKWKKLADDDRVWKYMCEQHIDRKCPQCGWGLPLLAVKKLRQQETIKSRKRKIEEVEEEEDSLENLPPRLDDTKTKIISEKCKIQKQMRKTRPWKAVYSERYQVERNWRKGVYQIRPFLGHDDGVLCCQYDNGKLLMTGSYDKTIKIWNVETGELIRTLRGHTRGVKTLAFDEQKLISGGFDNTIKVWNYRTGDCISTYTGHEEGVTTVDFHDKVIVSGSADHTVKVWHVETRTCYTLRGHNGWVTCVKMDPKSGTIFSASEDSTIRIWDLETNKCLKTLGGIESNGHIGQIQSIIPFTVKDTLTTEVDDVVNSPSDQIHEEQADDDEPLDIPNLPTHLLSASLDNTIKLWDVKTGKCVRTQFGHIEGVWSIAADTFRIVSGAHDKLIKVWDLQTGNCMHTFGG